MNKEDFLRMEMGYSMKKAQLNAIITLTTIVILFTFMNLFSVQSSVMTTISILIVISIFFVLITVESFEAYRIFEKLKKMNRGSR